MPYKTRKIRGKNCYRVYNPKKNHTFSKCASKENAEKQVRLLRALQFNKSFVPTGMRTRKVTKRGSNRKSTSKTRSKRR